MKLQSASRAARHQANQLAPHSLILVHAIQGKQSEVDAIATEFEVKAPERLGDGFREQECFGLKHRADLIDVGPVAINEEVFDSRSEINQGRDLRGVGWVGCADRHVRQDRPSRAWYAP